MTEHEINKSIAGWCGWTSCQYIEGLRDVNGIPPKNWKGNLISGLNIAWIPYYCNDLNAMHEAEKVLTFEQLTEMAERLSGDLTEVMHATARQRAEAFMKTIGKWEVEP